jgi:hypothetical protein
VGDLDDRRALAVELLEQVHDRLALARVQVAGGLVCQQKLRIRDHRPGDADQLLLPAGELAGEQVLLAHDAEAVERVTDDRGPLGALDVSVGQRHIQILVDGQRIQQVEVLEHEADILLVQGQAFLRLELVDRVVVEVVFPLPIAVQHAEDVQQRGLARRRGPHDREEVTLCDVQIDLPQDIVLARSCFVTLLDVLQLNHRISSSRLPFSIVRRRRTTLWPMTSN